MTTPCGRQHRCHAGDEVVEVGDVGEDVVGDQQVGAAALGHEPGGELAAEELDDGLDAPLPGDLGDVGGGLDAERRDAALDEVLEQVAVVAGELDHQAVRAEPEALDRRSPRSRARARPRSPSRRRSRRTR